MRESMMKESSAMEDYQRALAVLSIKSVRSFSCFLSGKANGIILFARR